MKNDRFKIRVLYLMLYTPLIFCGLEFIPFPHTSETFIERIPFQIFSRNISLIISFFYLFIFFLTRYIKLFIVFIFLLLLHFFWTDFESICNDISYEFNKNRKSKIALFLGMKMNINDDKILFEWPTFFDSFNQLIFQPNNNILIDDSDIEKVRIIDKDWYELKKDVQ